MMTKRTGMTQTNAGMLGYEALANASFGPASNVYRTILDVRTVSARRRTERVGVCNGSPDWVRRA